MKFALIPVITWALALTGCIGVEQKFVPAQLADTSEEAIAKLPSHVSQALYRPNIRLGPIDIENPTTISILPANSGPYQGNNPAMPEVFNFFEQEGVCWIIRSDNSELYELPDLECIPTISQ